ncbi:membrane-bound lytic murein transglycosylase D [Saccharicrinis carchari]|uniref:Membrane-bound lytic murein transglycosylase D n=1 Tax=Saccharicrinis carchari TaxID=1168039 RepID=A0A521C0L1_SACCC|nr:lytic transglycosylase domain-containing protein [Saccharicrinis carchari]SMO52977.1 membrane-bound lytic murein transglycosylase D [Saccharicrinis carchari]
MFRFLTIGAVAVLLTNTLGAQQTVIKDSLTVIADTLQQDSVVLDSDVEKGFFTENLDTVKVDAKVEEEIMPLSFPKDLPDSVYIQRLQAIESPLEFPFNKKVKAYIELYTQRKRGQVEVMLGLSDYYFPMFEEALDAANLPLELKYLPIIESALNPRAFSRAGASGLWQFMYGTGRMYGLKLDSYVDDRRDPLKSTQAAVKFLQDLYNIYGDWYLVIAAYNCGPGNVNKAIYRSGGKRDFWQIYYRLPRETRGYVPAFIAAAYTMNYYKEHRITPKPAKLNEATDTLMISDLLHFNQIAAVTGLSVEKLRALNPQYRRDIIPAKKNTYSLRLPFDATEKFIALEDSIFGYQREKYFVSNRLVVSPESSYNVPVSAPKNKAKVYYTVKSGDAVGLIAEWFNVYSSDLRYWNNIRRNLIKVGQKLVIYVPKDKVEHYKKINSMSYAQKQAGKGKTITASAASNKSQQNSSEFKANEYTYYTVRRGDNLWTIAKRYPGISNQNIMEFNNLTDASKIKPGQRLKIPRKG